MTPDTLDAPFFLIAMPQIVDPFFRRSVVLIIEHHEGGTVGFIVNRQTEIPVSPLVGELGAEWGGDAGAKAFFGGPVSTQVGTIVFAPERGYEAAATVVKAAPGVLLSQDIEFLRSIAGTPPHDFRLFVGFAGWSPGQLEAEIERNDWLVAPFDTRFVFSPDPNGVWEGALDSIGVRPESLPSWTDGGSEESN